MMSGEELEHIVSNDHHIYVQLSNVIIDTLKNGKEINIKTILAEFQRLIEI